MKNSILKWVEKTKEGQVTKAATFCDKKYLAALTAMISDSCSEINQGQIAARNTDSFSEAEVLVQEPSCRSASNSLGRSIAESVNHDNYHHISCYSWLISKWINIFRRNNEVYLATNSPKIPSKRLILFATFNQDSQLPLG